MSSIINNNVNIRILNIEIHNEINPTNIVLYQDDLNYYKFFINLLDNSQRFIIPDDTRLTLKLDGIVLPATSYRIMDKYLGAIELKMSAEYFKKDKVFIDTALAHILSIELYSESTFGLHSAVFTVTTGKDSGRQNMDSQLGIGSGTTTQMSTMPSPSWNIIQQDDRPNFDVPDVPDSPTEPDDSNDTGTHLIFDGGELF